MRDDSVKKIILRGKKLGHWLFVLTVICSAWGRWAAALEPKIEETKVVVFYPEIRQPYAGLYKEILAGIRATLNASVDELKIVKDYQVSQIRSWLIEHPGSLIIALGQRAAKACQKLKPHQPVVLGAVLFIPKSCADQQITLSLTPEPKELFKRLLQLKPGIRNIYTVYEPGVNQWLINLASEQSQKLHLQLHAFPSDNLKQSAIIYRELLNKLNKDTDAIWLLQDRKSVDEITILPLLLRASWERQLVLFSSNLAHVNRGVLFALYPDNFLLGSGLAEIALELKQNLKSGNKIIPLSHLKGAINFRTAKHIKIIMSPDMADKFNLFFPKRR